MKLLNSLESANKLVYDNTTSGLVSVNVQAAIDELKQGLTTLLPSGGSTGQVLTITSGSNIAWKDSIWSTSRTLSLSGHASGSVSMDGSSNVSLAVTIPSNVPFVVGTQTATTASWEGVAADLSELVNGTTIRYWLPRTSAADVTLNLTLKDGSTTGTINCYYGGTTRLSTHYAAGNIVVLTYVVGQLINGTAYTGWWAHGQHYSNSYDRTYWGNTVTAGAAINRYKILMQGPDDKFYPLTAENSTGATKTISTQEFRLGANILYYNTSTVINANGTLTDVYSEIVTSNLQYTANQSSWTSQKLIYLVGIINSNGNFVLDNSSYTSFITQDLPTTNDDKVYILLGYMYSTTAMRLFQHHPVYEFKNGQIRPYIPNHTHSADDGGQLSITGATTGTLTVARGGTGATTFTAGRILFGNDTSAINTNANLFWNNSNSRLGIGTTTPNEVLEVVGSAKATSFKTASWEILQDATTGSMKFVYG